MIKFIKEQKCTQAKQVLIEKAQEFGNSYFYELGLNLKFCAGIKRFQEYADSSELYRYIKN